MSAAYLRLYVCSLRSFGSIESGINDGQDLIQPRRRELV